MKTTIEFKPGYGYDKPEEHPDVAPAFDMEADELSFVDKNMSSDGDTVSISLLKKVVWENE